jgi:hypothetical protein
MACGHVQSVAAPPTVRSLKICPLPLPPLNKSAPSRHPPTKFQNFCPPIFKILDPPLAVSCCVKHVGVVVITLASWPKGTRFESRQRHYVGTCNLRQVTQSHCLSPTIRRSFVDIWSINKRYLPFLCCEFKLWAPFGIIDIIVIAWMMNSDLNAQ